VHTLTASQPLGWTGYACRVDAEMLAEVGPSPAERPHVYVCGPTSSRPSQRRSCTSGTPRWEARQSGLDRQEAEMDALMLDGNAVAGICRSPRAGSRAAALAELYSNLGQQGYKAYERVDGRPIVTDAARILAHSAT
jgi:hypothetical protein